MTTHYFEFEFEFNGKIIPATCHVYYHDKNGTEIFYKYPLYRVAINYHKVSPDVFLFYEMANDDKRFFSYPLPDLKGKISRLIAEKLETFDYRQTEYKVVKKPFWA